MKSFREFDQVDWYALFAFIGCVVMVAGALGFVGMIPGGGAMIWVFVCGLILSAASCALFYLQRRTIIRESEE